MRKIVIKDDQLKIFIRNNKDYLLPLSTTAVSILLFIFFLIPQFQNYLGLREETKIELAKLAVLKNNLNTLSTINETSLNDQLKISEKALPANKDFASILGGVSSAAINSGVTLGDFEFLVGDLTKSPSNLSQFPTLTLVVNINSDLNGLLKFVDQMEKTLPLSEISSIKDSNNTTSVSLVFYYKPFSPVNLSEDDQIGPISPKDYSFLTTLSSWNNADAQPMISVPIPTSTDSGSLTTPF